MLLQSYYNKLQLHVITKFKEKQKSDNITNKPTQHCK